MSARKEGRDGDTDYRGEHVRRNQRPASMTIVHEQTPMDRLGHSQYR